MRSTTILDLPPALGVLADHGLLGPLAVHGATRLATLLDVDDEREVLALALALRAPSSGHVALDLSRVRDLAASDRLDDLDHDARERLDRALVAMVAHLREVATSGASPLVGAPDHSDDAARALVVEGDLVYAQRWWDLEQRAATHLRTLRAPAPTTVVPTDEDVAAALDAVLGADHDRQRAAITSSLHRRLTVLAGGPGTGKTWTVARLLAVHAALADPTAPPSVALAAPTGKAAARLTEGVDEALAGGGLSVGLAAAVGRIVGGPGTTLHRLLGLRPGRRPWHHTDNPLPHDLVVVDEASMVPLELMGRLLDALAPSARLVLVGDPHQLASVEAGTVLGDVVTALDDDPALTTLQRVYRFRADSAIADLATAVRDGDVDAVRAALDDGADTTWHPDLAAAGAQVRDLAVSRGRRLVDAGRRGDVDGAVAALGDLVVLTAHHRGPTGVDALNATIESWLAAADLDWRPWDDRQVGRPVLVTANDHLLGIHNGDLGVFVRSDDGTVRTAFDLRDDRGNLRTVSPDRLPDHRGVHAMTIHKSQGSQWRHVVVVLPERPSPLLTRELLYTAVTRAREHVTVVGSPEILAAAVNTPVARASGLAGRLAPDGRPA